MSIEYTCACGESYSLPDSRLGQQMRCPFCYELQMVPIPEPPERRQWHPFAYLLLFLLVPLGGPVLVWLMPSQPIRASAPTVPPSAPAAAPVEPDETIASRTPTTTTGNTLADAVLQNYNEPPAFQEPDARARLEILYKMIVACNKNTHGGRLSRRHSVPSAEQLKSWLLSLTPRQRVTIDWRFNDRRRYVEFLRDSKRQQSGLVDLSAPLGGHEVILFDHPEDVFISPRDRKPFVIGNATVRFPANGYAHDQHVIVREQEGIEGLDNQFLEKRRELLSLSFNGQVDVFYLPVKD